jgi:hypothetical protein
MQQLISNVVITKRRENDMLLSHFRLRAKGEGTLTAEIDGTGESLGVIKPGFLLRELERRDDSVRVRDLFGREGWVPEMLIDRPELPTAALDTDTPDEVPHTETANDPRPRALPDATHSATDVATIGCGIAGDTSAPILPGFVVFAAAVGLATRRIKR